MKLQLIILAAGKGTRMKSELPKVIHEIGGQTMLERVVKSCAKVTDDIILVYSDNLQPYLPQFASRCKLVRQEPQLGTGHATWVAKDNLASNKYIGVMYGDNPLITSEIIGDLFMHTKNNVAAVNSLVFHCSEPNQYGRIVTDENGNFLKIVEAKFATPQELAITLCNSGVMTFAPGILQKYIDQCIVPKKDLPARELYLTDIVEICHAAGEKVAYYISSDSENVIGINTKEELENANHMLKNKKSGLE